jgi:hypothetical protein
LCAAGQAPKSDAEDRTGLGAGFIPARFARAVAIFCAGKVKSGLLEPDFKLRRKAQVGEGLAKAAFQGLRGRGINRDGEAQTEL